MNINSIPVIGWIIDIVLKASAAIPFWILWKPFGLGAKFFSFLPEKYTQIGFFETVLLFIILGILISLSPFRISQRNSSSS